MIFLKVLCCVRVIILIFFFVGLIKNECFFVLINCKGEFYWFYSFVFFFGNYDVYLDGCLVIIL